MGKVIRVNSKAQSYLERIGKYGQTPGDLIDAIIPIPYSCERCSIILGVTEGQLKIWNYCPHCGGDVSELKKLGISRESTDNKAIA